MFIRLLACLAVVVALCGCERVTDADQKAALETVRANLAAMEKEDLETAIATIHPKSPNYPGARDQTAAIFVEYQLKLDLEKAEVSRVTADGIEVHFVQTTQMIDGPEGFVDNRVEGVHLLKRDGSAWKIWSTRFQPPQTLDGQPLPVR